MPKNNQINQWVIQNNDKEFLESLKKQLYLEQRLSGDTQRDFAQRLECLLMNLEPLD